MRFFLFCNTRWRSEGNRLEIVSNGSAWVGSAQGGEYENGEKTSKGGVDE